MSTGWIDQIFDSSPDQAGPKHHTGAPASPAPTADSVVAASSPTQPQSGPEITATGRRWSKRSTAELSGAPDAPAPPLPADQPVPVRGYRSNSERAVFDVAEEFCPDEQLVVCLYHASGRRKGRVYKAVPWREYFEVMAEIEAQEVR